MKRIVIKVGSSTITHASGLLNLKKIDALACVISDLKNAGNEILLVSSGAIAAGKGKMKIEELKRINNLTSNLLSIGQELIITK